ncbi:MAG: xylulokinase [Candidatus Thorarchaeota archaeon]
MSESQLVVAIDVGTSGTRTALFDTNTGQLVTESYQEYSSIYPRPVWVEQNANDWWLTTCSTTKTALKHIGKQSKNLVGLSITNQRETIVPVDDKGTPLANAIVWQDRRTTPQCKTILKNVGADRVYKETGLTVDPYFSAPKILWFKEKKPQVFQHAHKFLLVHDFILYQLTDNFATDYSNASRTMLFGVNSMEWSDLMCESLEIPKEKLPRAIPPGTRIGEVSSRAAKATGLPSGLPVAVGGGDQQCGAVGVGVVIPGRIKATIGTGTFLLAHQETPQFDPQQRLLCSCHAVPGKWVIEASMFSSGIVYRWFRDQFGDEEKQLATFLQTDAYEFMNKQASQSPPGSRGIILLPHFVGAGAPYWNPDARGVIIGLALGHSRADVIRAIMEGTALEIRRNLEIMQELGIDIRELRITGGATRSAVWNQIQADIMQLKVLRSHIDEATALGAAILAAVGSGIYRDVNEASKKMVAVSEEYLPSEEWKSLYDQLYSVQTKAYQALEKAKVFSHLRTLDD